MGGGALGATAEGAGAGLLESDVGPAPIYLSFLTNTHNTQETKEEDEHAKLLLLGSYPGTGKINQVGLGNGEGTTLNLPLPGGSGDYAMGCAFDEVIAPSAQRFKPDIILVSAGYDAHALDPLAGLQFTTGTFYMLASSIKQLAAELCGGRCVFFLEGGYNLQSLSSSVADTFGAFLGEPSIAARFDDPAMLYEEPTRKIKEAIEKARYIHLL